jgi:hypothetical protein
LPVGEVPVANQQSEWGSEGETKSDAGKNLSGVLLDLHSATASIASLTSGKIVVDIAAFQRQPGRQSLQNPDQSGTVALTRCEVTKSAQAICLVR